MVQPKVPWPVLVYRLLYRVGPTTGVPSGVIGRSPVQKLACLTSPPCGNRSVTECSSVARRGSRRRWLKPASSAVPPTRIRSPKRVIPILKVSSITVETGAASGFATGIVRE